MIRYLTAEEVIKIHSVMIERYGGSHGLRDHTALEAATMRPQSGYYPNIQTEALALMESLAINHPFIDGNKRVALAACEVFLILNDYEITLSSNLLYEGIMELFETQNFNLKGLETLLLEHIHPT
jgi:death-on-curing protein